jgi:transcriptional regulator with XRE-family HTH domain
MLVRYQYLNNSIIMKHNFARDLKAARRRAGLSQADCAHLLKVNQTRVSKIEAGLRQPTASEICMLCIIYGEAPAELCRSATTAASGALRERLATIPECAVHWRSRKRRLDALNTLAGRLEANDSLACER